MASGLRGELQELMMRVLHVMASGARGGGADHLLGLLPALAHWGADCVAAVGGDGPLQEELRARGVAVEPLEMMQSRWDPRVLVRLKRCTARVAPALVHFHGTRAAFFAAALPSWGARRYGRIYSVHGLSYRKEMGGVGKAIFAAAERWACRRCDAVISVSQADLLDLQRRGYVRRQRGYHVPNAVDTERFAPAAPQRRQAARRRLGLAPEAFVVGTVARLVAQKAVSDLVRAVGHCPAGTQLVVVGDGPLRAAVEAEAAQVGRAVHFLGSRGDVAEILPAFDVFALSSRWEGEPIALLEAMASALPVVATATCGARELLEASGAGVLVEVGAPEAMGRALSELGSQPRVRQALGAKARQFAAGRSYAQQAQRIWSIYQEVLAA